MKKIIIVDDDPDLLFTLKAILEYSDKGYEVTTFDGGAKCIQHLKKEIPDLILSDIMMPEMNGWELFEKIKKSPKLKKIPFIFISAACAETSKTKAELQADDFIEKPVTPEEILKKIENIFHKQQL